MVKAGAAKRSDDGRAQVLGALKAADAYFEAADLHAAAREIEAVQGQIQELKFIEGRACVMVLVAKIYAKQGQLSTEDQLDEALDLAADAQEKFQKLGAKRCEAAAYLASAMARYANKKFEDGNLAAKEAQLIFQKANDRAAEAEVLKVVADGYVLEARTKRAATMLGQARTIYAELGDKAREADTFHRLGEVEVAANDQAKASGLQNGSGDVPGCWRQ